MSKTVSRRQSKIWWLLSEGFVVFLGVGAALAGQAWFEERADREVERELLVNVLAEARENASLYERESLAPQIASLTDLSTLLVNESLPDRTMRIAETAPVLLNTHGSGLITAALDEALRAGNLRLIQDASIRSELARYRDMVRRVFERFDDHQDWTNSDVRSFLLRQGIYRDTNTDLPALSRAELQERGAALAASLYFESLVRDQLFLNDQLQRTVTNAASSLQLIIQELEAATAAL